MMERFERVFKARLLDLQYDPQDPPEPALIVHIDEHSLEA